MFQMDLHMHSDFSDGSDSVSSLIKKATDLGISTISITDHDNVDAYFTLPSNYNLKIISGVELTCNYHGHMKHILGYGFDINKMQEFLKKKFSKNQLIQNQKRYYDLFLRKCIDFGFVFAQDNDIEFIGRKSEAFINIYDKLRGHEQNYLLAPELHNISKFYWKYYANLESRLYVDEISDHIDPIEALNLIHKCGGLAIVAHPFQYGQEKEQVVLFLDDCIKCGYDGIEVFHYSHSRDNIEFLLQYAKEKDVFISAGSDYHGKLKEDIMLGIESEIIDIKMFKWIKMMEERHLFV